VLLNTERIKQYMDAEGLDGLIASTLENVFYLSGVWQLGQELFPHDAEGYVVATRDAPDAGTMVIGVGEADMALESYPSVTKAVTYGTFWREMPHDPSIPLDHDEQRVKELTMDVAPKANSVEALAAAIEMNGLANKTIGVDERGAKRDLLDQLAARFPNATIKPASQVFRRIRMVKTDDELARMKATLDATEFAFNATIDAVHEGITERELFHVYERAITECGARPGFTLIRFGRGMALGQMAPGDTKLTKGDYLWFDIGCTKDGYRSDIGRVVAFGQPDPRLVLLQSAITAGQDRAIELMKPGAVAKDIFNAAVERVRESGIPHYKRHHVGHGIGVEYYDLPIITPNTDIPLEANMIFEIETPYYEFGFGGAFIEDTVVVGQNGSRIITKLQREPIQVIAA
jgi:Xaa-Pro aminopeptidase